MSQSFRRRRLLLAGTGLAGATPAAQAAQAGRAAASPFLNVVDFGAAGDGTRLNSASIQQAIDACAARGGGTVYFPAGRFLSGTLVVRSNVRLHLDAGAVLLGSKNLADYPVKVAAVRSYTDNYTDKSLIYAEDVENISLEGRGTIDGQGAAFKGPYKVRPYMIRVINCRNVSVSGVTIRDSPMWVQHYLACDRVDIRGITVHSLVNANNDGIDIDGCDRVRISDCEIVSGDDAIVLKSTLLRPCRNVAVTNCVLSTRCNAFKLGTESNGGFENIVFSNSTVYDTRLAGIALEIVDGGTLDRVSISNIAMNKVGAPIFARLGNRARPFEEGGPKQPVGKFRNVQISNVQATGCGRTGCAIAGLPDHYIERLTLENVRLEFDGGGKAEDARREIPEFPDKYPEYSMFGVLPAYGIFCRHARHVHLRGVELRHAGPEERPPVHWEDVQDLHISELSAEA